MKNYLSKYWMQIVFFVVLFFGAIGNNYANDLGEVGLKIEAEKGAVGYDKVKAWNDALEGGLNAMRKNTDYLETLSPYSSGTLSRKFSSMDIHEEAMIRHYTTDAHVALNNAIKSGSNLSDDLLEFKNTLNIALDKLPDNVGIVHRGLDELNSIAAEFWTVGQKIQRPAFVSSSTSESIAETFMNLRGGHVVLKIESKTGKLIKDAAVNPNELEVLFKSGKEFEVIKAATPKPGNASILEVTLKEL